MSSFFKSEAAILHLFLPKDRKRTFQGKLQRGGGLLKWVLKGEYEFLWSSRVKMAFAPRNNLYKGLDACLGVPSSQCRGEVRYPVCRERQEDASGQAERG